MKRALALVLISIVAAALGGSCTRDESGSEPKRPIEPAYLPPPKTTVRVAQAIPPTPLSAHTPLPSWSPTALPTAKTPSLPVAEATRVPATVEQTEASRPAAKDTPKAVETATLARKGVVGKGTDLLAGPSAEAQIRGTFQGRTDVDVFESGGGYSRVKAPVVGGGAVEGWVASASIRLPGEKAAVVTKGAKPEKPVPVPGGDGGKAVATVTKAPGQKAAAAKPGGESKGPDTILLKALAGMTAKRLGTPFTHKSHYDDYEVKCIECHHAVKAKGGAVPVTKTCSDAGCHLADQCDGQTVAKKNKECPIFEEAYHVSCIGCHRAQGGPTKCAECHTG